MAESANVKTQHSLTISAPGQGTVADLRNAADQREGRHGYHYIATDTWIGATPVGRLDFLTDGNDQLLKYNRAVVIDGFDLMGKEERRQVIDLFKLWMQNHRDQQLAVHWVLTSYNAERVLEITTELFPLISGLWEFEK